MAQTHAVSFSWFATERFIRSDCTQKENCRAFHKLSTDIKLYDTLQTKMNEMARSMKRQRSSISGRKLMKTRKFCGKQILGVLEKQYDLWDLNVLDCSEKKIVKKKKDLSALTSSDQNGRPFSGKIFSTPKAGDLLTKQRPQCASSSGHPQGPKSENFRLLRAEIFTNEDDAPARPAAPLAADGRSCENRQKIYNFHRLQRDQCVTRKFAISFQIGWFAWTTLQRMAARGH